MALGFISYSMSVHYFILFAAVHFGVIDTIAPAAIEVHIPDLVTKKASALHWAN